MSTWNTDVYLHVNHLTSIADDDGKLGMFAWSQDHTVVVMHYFEDVDAIGFESPITLRELQDLARGWAKERKLPQKRDTVIEVVCCCPNKARARYPEAWRDYGIEFVGWWDETTITYTMPLKEGHLIHIYPKIDVVH